MTAGINMPISSSPTRKRGARGNRTSFALGSRFRGNDDELWNGVIFANALRPIASREIMPVHPRALDYTSSHLDGMIPDEAELTAGVKIEPGKPYGFFTDTTLCIGCKACEVACKEWNNLPADALHLTGHELRQHGRALRHDLAPCRLHRKIAAAGRGSDGAAPPNGALPERLADDERCVQALPQCAVPGSLPDRGAVPHRVRHRRGAAGYLQWLRLLRAGLPVRGRRASACWTARRTNAPCATIG